MKLHRFLTVLAVCLMLPTLVSAQSDKDDKKGDEDKEVLPLTEAEKAEIQQTLLAQLTTVYSKCMQIENVKRPTAKGKGTADYEVDEDGGTTFAGGTATGKAKMFYSDAAAWKKLSKAEQDAIVEKGNKALTDCAKGSGLTLNLEGPVTAKLKFSFTGGGGAATLQVTSFEAVLHADN